MYLLAATGDSDPATAIALSVVSLLVLVVVGVLTELTRRRALKVDTTVGEPPVHGADQSTVAEHVASTDAKLDLAIAQLDTMHDLVTANGSLMTSRLDHIDAVMADRGRQMGEIRTSLHEHGVRIGRLTDRLNVVETRLDTCPATSTPSTGG